VFVSGAFEPDIYVEVDDGQIVAVTAVPPPAPATIQSFSGHAIFPGAVNTHCHSYLSLLRGKLDELALAAWLAEVYREVAVFDASAAYVGALLAFGEMLRASQLPEQLRRSPRTLWNRRMGDARYDQFLPERAD
jgi:cytosine/adenosine deaminase-related metal-dependent hydrolase